MELKDLANYGSFGAAVPGMSRSFKKETNKYMDAEEKRRMEEQAAAEQAAAEQAAAQGMKKGGKVKMSSASKRADGCATKGKTRGKIV